jgi:hypothetical protein
MNYDNYVNDIEKIIRKNCLKYKGLNSSAKEFVPQQNGLQIDIKCINKGQNEKQNNKNSKSFFDSRLYDNLIVTSSEFDYFATSITPCNSPCDSVDESTLFDYLESDWMKRNIWLFE